MELNEIRSMWQAYDAKLEKTLKLNLHFIEMIQAQKVRSQLAPIFWQRAAAIILQSIILVLLFVFLYRNFFQVPYALSAIVLIAFFMIAFINSLKQIIIIKRMDYSNDIISIQSSLIMLQTNILNYARLVILCIPAFLAFPGVVSKAIKDFDLKWFSAFDIIAQSNGSWWTAQLAATLSLLPLCIWFYTQVSHKNIHKKFVKDFIQKSSGTQVRKAIEFVNELESLKHDSI
jgi:hypothetical protein